MEERETTTERFKDEVLAAIGCDSEIANEFAVELIDLCNRYEKKAPKDAAVSIISGMVKIGVPTAMINFATKDKIVSAALSASLMDRFMQFCKDHNTAAEKTISLMKLILNKGNDKKPEEPVQ